ncbi:cytochrome P450 4C1-like [Periplaneta americana]|uniref:cytochrome P450 4C1-like n=1 Tax=Periplaneta americana TaxID=6978 RepID=UPI0037E96845
MDVSLLLVAALIVLATWYFFLRDSKRAQFVRTVNLLPGPKSYPIVGTFLPIIFAKRSEVVKVVIDIANKYKPLFRTWIGGRFAEINIMEPEHLEVIMSSSKHIEKSFGYEFMKPWIGTGLLTSTGQKWHTHRKMITPTFHFKILESFVEVFAEKSEILVDKLQKEVGSQGFDVYPYITKCALDIICETAMGTPIFAQDNAESEYVKAVYEVSDIVIQRALRPWLHSNFIFKLSARGKRHDQCLRVLHGFTNKVIQERKAQLLGNGDKMQGYSGSEDEVIGKKKRKAFLDLLLEASLDGVKLTDMELREEVDTFMFEGHDTTSAGMCWALYLLGLHPEVQAKAFEEQERIFQGSIRSPTMKDLNEMKYLEQVIKESLRLYPSVPFIGRLLNEDVQLGGYTLPAGCFLALHIYQVHRNEKQFPNPHEFDPDNFLPERVAKRHPYAYVPFSAGPRNCVGQKFALLEEKTVLSYMLRHYKWSSLDKEEDVPIVADLVLRPLNGIRLKITKRGDKRL